MPTPTLSPERLRPTDLFAPEAPPEQPSIEKRAVDSLPGEYPQTSISTAPAVGELACRIEGAVPERPRLSDRFFRSKLGRLAMTGLASLGLTTGGAVIEASPALASNPVYTVINPDNDGTRSIYDRNSPNWNDTTRTAPDFSKYGDRLELICGTNGEPIGPNKNKRWHHARNITRPEAGITWIPDRYLNTPNKANQKTPGEKECGAAESGPQIKACYLNLRAPGKKLTFSYGGSHRYYGNAWQAAKNWTDAGAGISISPGSGDTYIKIEDVNDSAKGSYGEAVMPDSWKEPRTQVPTNPNTPSTITINLNRRVMDGLSDFHRTYVITHEIGHALGLAHSNACGHDNTSVMKAGDGALEKKSYNTPMPYDKNALKQLYS